MDDLTNVTSVGLTYSYLCKENKHTHLHLLKASIAAFHSWCSKRTIPVRYAVYACVKRGRIACLLVSVTDSPQLYYQKNVTVETGSLFKHSPLSLTAFIRQYTMKDANTIKTMNQLELGSSHSPSMSAHTFYKYMHS